MGIFLTRRFSALAFLVTLPLAAGVAQAQIQRSMTVATVIDKNQFFSPKLNLYFEDEILYPRMDRNTGLLLDAETILVVEASGVDPSGFNNLYHDLYMTKNITECFTYDSTATNGMAFIADSEADYYGTYNYSSDFTRAFVDGVEITKPSPIQDLPFLEQDPADPTKIYTRYPFTLKFLREPIAGQTIRCQGEIYLMVEFSV